MAPHPFQKRAFGPRPVRFVTGMKLKKIMLNRGLRRCGLACPRCGKMIKAGLVGPKNHLRMACEGECGMNMME